MKTVTVGDVDQGSGDLAGVYARGFWLTPASRSSVQDLVTPSGEHTDHKQFNSTMYFPKPFSRGFTPSDIFHSEFQTVFKL